MSRKIGFIGTGNMGQAMIKGIISSKIVSNENILVSDKDTFKLQDVSNKFNIKGETSNVELAKNVDILILSVKPNIYKILIDEIKDVIKEESDIMEENELIPKDVNSMISRVARTWFTSKLDADAGLS